MGSTRLSTAISLGAVAPVSLGAVTPPPADADALLGRLAGTALAAAIHSAHVVGGPRAPSALQAIFPQLRAPAVHRSAAEAFVAFAGLSPDDAPQALFLEAHGAEWDLLAALPSEARSRALLVCTRASTAPRGGRAPALPDLVAALAAEHQLVAWAPLAGAPGEGEALFVRRGHVRALLSPTAE